MFAKLVIPVAGVAQGQQIRIALNVQQGILKIKLQRSVLNVKLIV